MTLVLALCGGTAVGKSTLAQQLTKTLPAVAIGTDSYIEPRSHRIHSPNDRRSLHLDGLVRDLDRLKTGKPIWVGRYNHQLGRNDPAERILPVPMVIIEGAHALNTALLHLIDASVFIETPEHVMRRSRRARDERLGIAPDHWGSKWPEHYASYQQVILPQRAHADIILKFRRHRAGWRRIHDEIGVRICSRRKCEGFSTVLCRKPRKDGFSTFISDHSDPRSRNADNDAIAFAKSLSEATPS